MLGTAGGNVGAVWMMMAVDSCAFSEMIFQFGQ